LVDINIVDFINRDYSASILFRENKVYDPQGKLHILPPLITEDLNTFTKFSRILKNDLDVYVSKCLAEPV
jgi:hypothetical protein